MGVETRPRDLFEKVKQNIATQKTSIFFNPLTAYPTKWWNTPKQFVIRDLRSHFIFLFKIKMNKIPVFQVFKKWNNSKKGIYKNFPKDISAIARSHQCFKLSSCWFWLLIKNALLKKIYAFHLCIFFLNL